MVSCLIKTTFKALIVHQGIVNPKSCNYLKKKSPVRHVQFCKSSIEHYLNDEQTDFRIVKKICVCDICIIRNYVN